MEVRRFYEVASTFLPTYIDVTEMNLEVAFDYSSSDVYEQAMVRFNRKAQQLDMVILGPVHLQKIAYKRFILLRLTAPAMYAEDYAVWSM